jgi:chromosome segregation protein
MEFKKIQLNGFKSFADKTNFLIEEGLTGIVGPNGCGKSTIVESLRWVMGETSAKSMRGSGMEDVIFSGTSNKASKNIAEVSISVDNDNHDGPIQYKDLDKIEVRRKIEKDKGSKFYINDKEVRARDAQMFFADLSTGAHSPSMISQGRIGALVTAKPTDRRAILEEAAGISGLHVRRHEAELRLSAAENNLKRADELRRQQEKQLANLQKQAEEAIKYKLTYKIPGPDLFIQRDFKVFLSRSGFHQTLAPNFSSKLAETFSSIITAISIFFNLTLIYRSKYKTGFSFIQMFFYKVCFSYYIDFMKINFVIK